MSGDILDALPFWPGRYAVMSLLRRLLRRSGRSTCRMRRRPNWADDYFATRYLAWWIVANDLERVPSKIAELFKHER